ncbi:TetR/AcrR family transcriptional regulator [Litoribacillus peritrichatus]|uniref:TetR/AcrR family transcriptional regulator n=1 Tax=Litoribacillus peritrichatus TaxID=718191 RepID=A0ABP7MQ58_9GAMM
MPTPEKPRAKTLEKKQKILGIALDCFVKHGVEATTIEMIKDASGMSVGSLYHHFGNKDKIAAAVFIQGMYNFGQLTRAYLAKVKDNHGSAKDGIKAIVYANVDWISDNPDWAKFVFHHRTTVAKGDSDGKLRNDINVFFSDLIEWFKPFILKDEIKQLPIDVISSLISGPTHDYARHWLAGRNPVPLKEHRETFAEAAWLVLRNDG